MKTPILFLGDAPDSGTGLGRIGRDLAYLLATDPTSEFRVGYLGRGGVGSSHFPFQQYPYTPLPGNEWGEQILARVWADFVGNEPGVLFTVWDPTRCDFLTTIYPYMPECELKTFLTNRPFQLWSYLAIDSEMYGPHVGDILRGIDRRLYYTEFGARVGASLSGYNEEHAWLPHGLDESRFLRSRLGETYTPAAQVVAGQLGPNPIGCIMTNQARKDWGTMAQITAMMNTQPQTKFWWHTDIEDRYWNMHELIAQFRLQDKVVLTTGPFDDKT
ncbi:MAG: hypothetical protein E4G90_09665, partial [Gemmatimonadales bacterium]